MMEKVPTVVENKTQQTHYPPHLKKVLKTYQKSAIKSLQGPSTVLSNAAANEVDRDREPNCVVKKESLCSESSPELPLETPPPSQPPSAPVPQVPILSTADQSAELSETLIEGHRISCFIIGGEKRICFVQLLSTVLRNVQAYTINNVVTELFINFSSCNSEQLSALKAKGLLPAETPTCGLVTKPDAERLCSVLLHEGGASPEGIDKHSDYSFIVYHECFSGAKGIIYYEFYNEKNWCVQCMVCRRLFTPQMFVCHSCYMDKKRNSVHTLIETGICHWGFDSTNWRLYIHVLEEQPLYKKYTQILETFKALHRRSELIPLKRKQMLPEPSDSEKVKTTAIEESATAGTGIAATAATTATATTTMTITTPKVERVDEEEEEDERWFIKKKAKVTVSASIEDGPPHVPTYYGSFHTYYSNLCESWVRNAAAAAGYHSHPQVAPPWPNYNHVPYTKDTKYYFTTESVPFLAQEPPVLLHPERVVPLSQSEQFERSYQPNVSLVPPTKTSDGITYSKLKRGVIRVRSDISSPHSPSESAELSSAGSYLGKDSKSTEKTEIKTQPLSPSDSPLPVSRSPHISPTSASAEPLQDNGVNSVVEQVAAVLDALSDAEDAVRQRVISLVERLTLKIKHSDLEQQKYQDEMSQLRLRISQLEDVNMHLFCENTQLRQQLDKNEEKDVPIRSPSPSTNVVANNAVAASYLYSNRNTPGISSKQPICSPVSVITSPPPSLSVIRSESAA